MLSPYRLIQRTLSNINDCGLKLIRSAKGSGTLEQLKATVDQETYDNVVKALEHAETLDSVKSYSFRGTHFHKSSKDPTETEDILSVRFKLFSDTDGSNYVETLHIRKDGSYKSNKQD